MASGRRDPDQGPNPSGNLWFDATSQLRKLAATPRPAKEGSRSPKRVPIASSIAADNDEYPSQPREDPVVTLGHTTPLVGMKDILVKANSRILEDTNRTWEIMQHVKAFRTQAGLMQSLERCRGVGIDVTESLKQKQSSLTEFAELGRGLSSYMRDLEEIARKILLQLEADSSRLSTLIWRSAEEDLQRAASKLKLTLREIRPTVQLLILSVQVGSSREIELLEKLRQTKEKLNFVQRSNSNYGHGSGLNSPTESATVNPKWPKANVRRFGSLAYHPSRQYQDVPEAYTRRHSHVKSSLLKDSALWFIYEPMFLEWLESPKRDIFLCYGPQGVGKSAITSKVIDILEENEFQHAYFYFGIGKVQTAAGIALALLEQLCTASRYSPPLLSSKVLNKQPGVHWYMKDKEPTMNRSKSPLSLEQLPFRGLGKICRPTPPAHPPDVPKVTSSDKSPLPTETREGDQEDLRDESAGSSKPSLRAPLSPSMSQAYFAYAWPEQDASISKVWGDMERGSSELSIEPEPQLEPTKGEDQRHPPDEEEGTGREELPTPPKQSIEEDEWKLPDLNTLITVLQDTRRHCGSRLFIVLDGWDEENMIEPEEFRLLLNALRQVGCKIFLTCRSRPLDLRDETRLLYMSLSSGRRVALQQEDVVRFIERLLGETPRSEELGKQVARQLAEPSNGVFDLAKIITRLFVSEVLEVGRFRSDSLTFRFFIEKTKFLVDSGMITPHGLSVIRPPRSDLDRAANALMSWLSLSKVSLSKRALKEVFKNVLRAWKVSTAKGDGSSSTQSDIWP
ncbi:MAG: hypothetical protein M1839_004902, partial [Geoglossum umbratile]